MAPGVVLDVVCDLLLGVDVGAREHLLDGDNLALEAVAGNFDGLGYSGDVLLVVADAAVEVVVLDVWDVERVR